MKKFALRILIVLILLLSLTSSPYVIFAQSQNTAPVQVLSISQSSLSFGDQLTISLRNVRPTVGTLGVVISVTTSGGAIFEDADFYVTFSEQNGSDCKIERKTNAWINTSCNYNPSDHFSRDFVGVIDTGKIRSINHSVWNAYVISIIGYGSRAAQAYFNVQPSTEKPSPFSISYLTNSANSTTALKSVNPGDQIFIKIASTSTAPLTGKYSWGLSQGINLNDPSSCNEKKTECYLAFSIPQTIVDKNIVFYVSDPSGNIRSLPMVVGSITSSPSQQPISTNPAIDQINSGLPLIDKTAQSQCVFQSQSNILIDNITGIDPTTKSYDWWFRDETRHPLSANSFAVSPLYSSLPPDIAILSPLPMYTLTIPAGTDTRANVGPQNISEYKLFCLGLRDVKLEDDSRNCIELKFVNSLSDSTQNALCQDVALASTPEPTQPPLPCAKKGANGQCISVDTAIGNISTDPQGFVRAIFGIVLGLAGGIALVIIIISGYRFMASQGNPESITNARQQLTAAIVGLLFIMFSFVILQIIGVDILKIPGFNP